MILKMPKLSPTMEEGVIVKWHKAEGDRIEEGDLLFEVSTDKAIVEHTSLDGGYLRKILVKEGQEVKVGEPVGYFTESLEEECMEKVQHIENKSHHEGEVESHREGEPAPSPRKEVVKQERQIASPLAKKIAVERGIDLQEITGSGPGGRIVQRDVEEASTKKVAYPSSEIIPFSPMRKAIASRLQLSKTTIPHFYLSVCVNPAPLLSLKEELALYGKKVTVNDWMLRAVAMALAQHREINRGFDPEKQGIIQFASVDIAVAVSVSGGLTTPIIHQADQKSLLQISEEVRLLAKKAKEGKLQPSEYLGGSFSLSNLGMHGISHFQAIINPPQGAILAVGAIEDVPVVREGIVVPGQKMVLTLSADHRVIDGAEGALFLKTLRFLLEHPSGML